MRSSDWSSYVCSSDLTCGEGVCRMGRAQRNPSPAKHPAALKFGLASARARASAARQLPVRAHVVAGLTAGKFLPVILLLRFGLPEIPVRFDLLHLLSPPHARAVAFLSGVVGPALLPLPSLLIIFVLCNLFSSRF